MSTIAPLRGSPLPIPTHQSRGHSAASYTQPLTAAQLEWRKRAACLGADPHVFDPLAAHGNRVLPAAIAAAALRYCANCPVLAQCRDEADANHYLVGLWGGAYRTRRSDRHIGRGYKRVDLLTPIPRAGSDPS